MSESIIRELQAEIQELREEIKRLKYERLSFGRFEWDAEAHTISGILLAEGVWNGSFYPAKLLEEKYQLFQGIPLRVEHGEKDCGRVTKTEYDQMLKAIKFEAEVTCARIWNALSEGKYHAVSPAFWKTVEDGVVTDIDDVEELSLTDIPACSLCMIFAKDKKIEEEKESGEKVMPEKRVEKLEEEKPEGEETEAERRYYPYPYLRNVVLRIVVPVEVFEEVVSWLKERKVKVLGAPGYYPYPYPRPARQEDIEKLEKQIKSLAGQISEVFDAMKEFLEKSFEKKEVSEEPAEEPEKEELEISGAKAMLEMLKATAR